MTEINNQEQTQNEIHYQTIAEFLQSTPPNQFVHISDLASRQNVALYPNPQDIINTPPLLLQCPDHSCDGFRIFRCVPEETVLLQQINFRRFYLIYLCSNCQQTRKIYSLAAKLHKTGESVGECCKIGELPPFGPHVPSKLIELIGPDRDLFLQGRRCESQGLAIGAFAYYRRVVENQKNRILERILKVAKKIGTTPDTIDELNAAIKETQFKKALGMTKDVIPQKLFINDQNPILALHHALSVGVHRFSDEQCLALARDVRILLGDLSERMAFILKDDAEVGRALSSLMNLGNN